MDKIIAEQQLENQLCFELYKAANNIAKMYKYALKKQGLTFPQYLVLSALNEQDGVRVKELQTRLGISIGTLNPILNHLETQGWITKNKSQTDKRAMIICLTTKAKHCQTEIAASILQQKMRLNLGGIELPSLMANLDALNCELAGLADTRQK